MASDDPILTWDDCRAAGFCGPGLRAWFKSNEVDMRDFIRNGMPASEVRERTGDHAMIDLVVLAHYQRTAKD